MKKVNKILIKTAAVLDVLLTAVFAFIAPLLLLYDGHAVSLW